MNRKVFFVGYAISIALIIAATVFTGCKKDDDDDDNKNGLQYGTMQDIEGNTYKTIKIGEQTWMAENLRATKYNNGDTIPQVTDDTQWAMLAAPAYCWYQNDKENSGKTYGALYSWFTVATGKLCPAGWRVPSDTAWNELVTYLGGEKGIANKLMKEGTTLWKNLTVTPTNESGFSAIPGGKRDMSGHFYDQGTFAGWWTSTEFSPGYILIKHLQNSSDDLHTLGYVKFNGLSVRCIKE